MPFDVRMPDGTLIKNVPDGTTQEDILERYAASQQPAQQPKNRSFLDEVGRQVGLTARAGYEAFTSPATAVLEAGRTAVNLATGSNIPSFYSEQAKSLRSIGVPEPETAVERAVQSGTQAMASTAGFAKALPNVPAMASDLARQIPAAAAAGLVGQPTAEFVKDVTGSDTAAIIASVGLGAGAAKATGNAISAAQQGKQPLLTMQEVKQRATRAYTVMDDAGVVIKPNSAQKMVSDIRTALDDARMIQGTDAANEVNATLTQINKMIGSKDVSFNALEKMRGMVNDLKGSSNKDVRRLGNSAIGVVDRYITNLGPKDISAGQGKLDNAVKSVVAARKDWRNASRAEILDDALNVAEARALDPKASESELIRRGFINIASNKDKMKLFSKEEQNVIKSVANGGSLDKVLSTVARFNPFRSQLAAAGTTGLAFASSPIVAGSVAGAGLGADLAQSAIRQRAAQQAIKQIASGVVQAPPPNLSYRGLLTNALNPPTEE